ncbi:MAG: PLP-dependent cysteine synthase family protein [Longimicrobiales bacterium]
MAAVTERAVDAGAAGIGATLDAAIGDTPLVPIQRIASPRGARVYAKLESQNPGGSVKARAALAILQAAERAGQLGPGRTLLDASSGNTGIAYAMLCAERGYSCEICLPANASEERVKLLRAYGASLVITPAVDGSDGAIREARRRAGEHPDRYFYADQYNNAANVQAHYDGTGVEIWRQTRGRVTHFVAGLGTSGTFVGTGRRLRQYQPDIVLIAVQPASAFHGIEGLKHMPSAIVPGIWDPALPDGIVEVETEESQQMARRLAREEGLLAGVSGGAAIVAALRIAASLDDRAVLVTVLPDGGERYLSEPWIAPRAV